MTNEKRRGARRWGPVLIVAGIVLAGVAIMAFPGNPILWMLLLWCALLVGAGCVMIVGSGLSEKADG